MRRVFFSHNCLTMFYLQTPRRLHALGSQTSFLLSKTLRRHWTALHSAAMLNFRLFESAFSDSGHWDFLVLSALERLARTLIVQTVGPVSDASIVEKAGWAAVGLSASFARGPANTKARAFSAVIETIFLGAAFLLALSGLLAFTAFFL